MEVKTHIITSVTIAASISTYIAIPFSAGYVFGTILGSVLPDLDKKDSFIGRRSLGVSYIIQMLFGHRGFTHSVFCWILVTILCLYHPSHFTYGLSVGYAGHILGDFFSNRGVPIFYPVIKKPFTPSSLLTYKTGGLSEKLILMSTVIILLIIMLDGDLFHELIQSVRQWVDHL
ncbi:metal-dependent hydrolase [Piscibacillus salipiscarius]|uniref:Metal-dependent hydrolase n=1 Tax=Piscibacillus salipiscarius TaxID=299480 RepID=A0ABW5QDB7_9BACI|nr:metal-dependent hydrolase [Piscibacillus salipiscarius]